MAKRRPLGEILLEMKALDPMQLTSALAHHRQWGVPLAQAVLEKRFCTPQQVMQALSRQAGVNVVDLDQQPPTDRRVAEMLPRKTAEQYRVVPLRVEGKRSEVLVVAIAAPASLEALDAVQSVTGKQRVIPYLATDDAIARALSRLYGSDLPEERMGPAFAQPPRVAGEQEVDLAGELPLPLSKETREVIRQAAAHHGISEAEVVARVLESWAKRAPG